MKKFRVVGILQTANLKEIDFKIDVKKQGDQEKIAIKKIASNLKIPAKTAKNLFKRSKIKILKE